MMEQAKAEGFETFMDGAGNVFFGIGDFTQKPLY